MTSHAGPVDTDAPPAGDEGPPADGVPGSSPDRPGWLRRRNLTLPGCWGALLASALSFTPSLLPRGGIVQGLVWGIAAAIGYGVAVAGAAIWRAFADRDARAPRPRSWRVLLITAAVLLVVAFALGQYWQDEIRNMMGITAYNIFYVVLSPLVAVAVFFAILAPSRWLRNLYRWAARLLARHVGQRAAHATGWILVVGLTYLLVTGVILDGFVALANEAFHTRNGLTAEGVHQPTSTLRSGGPGSLVAWDTLGRQGRKFTGLGPTAAQITAVTDKPAKEPIRVYAGTESGPDAEARAQLAVADLERAGGFARKDLLVMTTTGSGWVDPAAVDSFEYLADGDSAVVSMQYSYLPSWLSYLVDQTKAREAGRALFDAVYDRWSKLPADSRPKLLVAGESLGSFGGEAAFSGEYDMANRTDGVLFAGPPNFNTLFREFSDGRDPNTPEVQPVYQDGRTVRFANDASVSVPPEKAPWEGTRALYLMHPSDPIVWWSPRLAIHQPAWIAEPPGDDVLRAVIYIPFVTFWQVTADLPFSTGVPGGHGHKYTTEYVDGWNDVMQPPGVTAHELDTIRGIIAAEG